MDLQVLIDRVTEEVMRSLGNLCCGGNPTVTILSNKTEETLKELLQEKFEVTESDGSTSDYMVLSKEKYEELISGKALPSTTCDIPHHSVIDFTEKKVITQRDLTSLNFTTIHTIKIKKSTIITALAKEMLQSRGVTMEFS